MFAITIIEKQIFAREGLRSLLNDNSRNLLLSVQKRILLVYAHGDTYDFLSASHQKNPDIIILGIDFCDNQCTDIVQSIKQRHPGAKILALSNDSRDMSVRSAFRAGCNGYLLKSSSPCQLEEAIGRVMKGDYYVSNDILSVILKSYMKSHSFDELEQSENNNLTERERQLLKLISAGYKNKQIADIFHLSIKTVEAHRTNLMRKMNVNNAAELSAKANRIGVVF